MHHWQFLNEKLGKDIVSHCIQPFLLPVNGMSVREKWLDVMGEIDWIGCECMPDDNITAKMIMARIAECHNDPDCLMFTERVNRILAINNVGTLKARAAKYQLIENLDFYCQGKSLLPSEIGDGSFGMGWESY